MISDEIKKGMLKPYECASKSTYYNENTFESASLATGCVLKVVDQVCSKKVLTQNFLIHTIHYK